MGPTGIGANEIRPNMNRLLGQAKLRQIPKRMQHAKPFMLPVVYTLLCIVAKWDWGEAVGPFQPSLAHERAQVHNSPAPLPGTSPARIC